MSNIGNTQQGGLACITLPLNIYVRSPASSGVPEMRVENGVTLVINAYLEK